MLWSHVLPLEEDGAPDHPCAGTQQPDRGWGAGVRPGGAEKIRHSHAFQSGDRATEPRVLLCMSVTRTWQRRGRRVPRQAEATAGVVQDGLMLKDVSAALVKV